jgi:AraC-like DNA-binding protein
LLIIVAIGVSVRYLFNKYPRITESEPQLIQKEYKPINKIYKDKILSAEQQAHYFKIISDYINTKPTRDTKFNKIQLTTDLRLPKYVVYLYFNQQHGMPFGAWKTTERIKDAIDLIQQGYLKSKTIESLARTVGFSSRSRFVEAFIKIQGCTPLEYHASVFNLKD